MKKSQPIEDRYEWSSSFFVALRNTGNIWYSCQAAGVSRTMVYKAQKTSKEFRAAWKDAMEDAVEALEAMARQRALKSSDLLLIFLLKAHRPDKYRETVRQEWTGDGGGPVTIRVVYEDGKPLALPVSPLRLLAGRNGGDGGGP